MWWRPACVTNIPPFMNNSWPTLSACPYCCQIYDIGLVLLSVISNRAGTGSNHTNLYHHMVPEGSFKAEFCQKIQKRK